MVIFFVTVPTFMPLWCARGVAAGHYTRKTTASVSCLMVILNAFHALFPFLIIFSAPVLMCLVFFFLLLHNVSLVYVMKPAAELNHSCYIIYNV